MTPDQIALITAIVHSLSTWPVGLLIFLVCIGPWILCFGLNRMQETRFEAIIRMYENNVQLVKACTTTAQVLIEVVSKNTSKWTEAIEKIETNQFCPVARVQKTRGEDVR